MLKDLYCNYERPGRGILTWECANYKLGEAKLKRIEVENALQKLAKGKAVGIDGLPDDTLHEISKVKPKGEQKLDGVKFIQDNLEETLNSTLWPRYLGTARVIPLSKTDSAFPLANEIRTISILPAWSKLLELVILGRLNKKLYSFLGTISDSQMGFRAGAGTEV